MIGGSLGEGSRYWEKSRFAQSGVVSTWARTRAVIRETGGLGGDSWGDFGFEGNLPLRPFKESVLTT